MHPKMDIWEVEAAAISLKFFSKEKIKYPLMLGKDLILQNIDSWIVDG